MKQQNQTYNNLTLYKESIKATKKKFQMKQQNQAYNNLTLYK